MGIKDVKLNPVASILNLTKALKFDSIRNDGWYNLLTGLGLASKDKRMGGNVLWDRQRESDAEHLYAQDDTAARVVDLPPMDGTREWIEFKIAKDANNQSQDSALEDMKKVEDYLNLKLKAKNKLKQCWEWSRLYGGAATLMVVEDGKELSEPLDPKSVRVLKSLVVLNRYELNYHTIDRDLTSENFGLPLLYYVAPRTSDSAANSLIHYSRLIRMDGVVLPRILHESNEHWGDSVLTRLFNVLRNYNLAHDSAAAIMNDFRITILKLKNLVDMVSGMPNGDALLKKRIELMNISKSVLNSIVLDADSEAYENQQTNLAGLKDILSAINDRLVAATGLPHTLILGEGASGTLGGGGKSEEKNYFNYVNGEQERLLQPGLDTLIEIIQLSKQGPTNGREVPGLTWKFRSLYQTDDTEMANIHKAQAEADSIYLDRGVISPEEVANSRFGQDEYSLETSLDFDARAELENTEVENEPTPPTEPNGTPNANPNVDSLNHTDQGEAHVHLDGFGAYTTGAIDGDSADPNHRHLDSRGSLTSSAIPTEDGYSHYHRLEGSNKASSSAIMVSHQISTDHMDVIEEKGGKWVLYSADKSKILGTFETKEEAMKRLKEVEYFKDK